MSRRRPPSLTLLALALLAMLPALPAFADPQSNGGGRGGRQQQDQGNNRADHSSLSDAVRRVERDTRGEVLSAERVQFDGRDMHRVKVVDDQGRVRVFMQDPERREGNGPQRGNGGSNNGNNDRGQAPRRPPARGDDD